jgi:hypothetical protein
MDERRRLIELERDNSAADKLYVGKASFVDPAVQSTSDSVGARTTNVQGERDLDSENARISSFMVKQWEKNIVQSMREVSLSKNPTKQKLEDLADGVLNRLWCIDDSGKRVGMIVASSDGEDGEMVELKDLNLIDGSKSFYFVDLTEYNARTPADVYTVDHASVLSLNNYKDEDALAVYEDNIKHISDLVLNYARAYPTFRLFFVREGTEGEIYYKYIEDDMYGYSSVISVDITDDINDAAIARITLSNISGVLNTAEFADEANLYGKAESESEDLDEDSINKSKLIEKIKLVPGTNILIKMGYGNNPDTLKTVFTGAIAEVTEGPIVEIVAQSYKTELFRQVNFLSDKEWQEEVFKMIKGQSRKSAICHKYLIFRVLQELATLPLDNSFNSAGGIPHIGRFISLREKMMGGSRYSEFRGSNPDLALEADAENAPLNAVASSVLVGAGTVAGIFSRGKLLKGAATTLAAAGAAGFATNAGNNYLTYLNSYSREFMHTNAMRNVMVTNRAATDGFFDFLGKKWLVDGTGWDALQEISRYRTGNICQIVPFGTEATLFFGKPTDLYHYRPISQKTRADYKAIPAVIGSVTSSIGFSEIYGGFLTSDEYGLSIHRKFMRNEFLWDDDCPLSGEGTDWDRRCHQTLAGLPDDFSTENIVKIHEKLDFLEDMEEFPTFLDAKEFIDRIIDRLDNTDNSGAKAQGKTFHIAVREPRGQFGGSYNLTDRKPQEIKLLVHKGSFVQPRFYILFKLKIKNGQAVSPSNDSLVIINKRDLPRLGYGSLPENSTVIFGANVYTQDIPKGRISVLRTGWTHYRGHLFSPLPQLREKIGLVDPVNGQFNFRGEPISIPLYSNNNSYAIAYYGGVITAKTGRRDVKYIPNERNLTEKTVELTSENVDGRPIILYQSEKEDYQYLNSIDPELFKFLFIVFFGLQTTKDPENEGKIRIMELHSGLQNIWKPYTELVMMGIGQGKADSTLDVPQQVAEFYKKLVDIKTYFNDGDLSKRYIDVVAPRNLYDNENLRLNPLILEDYVRNQVRRGAFTEEEAREYKDKVRQIASHYAAGIIINQHLREYGIRDMYSLFDTEYSYGQRFGERDQRFEPTGFYGKTILNLIDKIEERTDFDITPAIKEKLKAEGITEEFDRSNPLHILIAGHTLRDIDDGELAHEYDHLSSIGEVSENRILDIQGFINRAQAIENSGGLNFSDSQAILTSYTAGQFDGGTSNPDFLKYMMNFGSFIDGGVGSPKSMYQVLIENVDAYKLFLIFFARWLRQYKDGDTAGLAKALKAINASQKATNDIVKPDTKRFQDTHLIMSGHDIIENNIIATSSEMANNILLMAPHKLKIKAQNSEDSDRPIYKVDEGDSKFAPYPNYQYGGVDWNPYGRPETRKQRVVVEKNALSDQQRLIALIRHMSDSIRPMYRGNLKIIGRNIKPHDKVFLFDKNKDMYGMVEVERVVHNMNSNTGWTTTIIPRAFVNEMEPTATLQNMFDTSFITNTYRALSAVNTALDIWTVMSLISIPFSGGAGTVAAGAGNAGRQAAETVGKNAVRKFLQRMAQKSLVKGFRLGGKGTFYKTAWSLARKKEWGALRTYAASQRSNVWYALGAGASRYLRFSALNYGLDLSKSVAGAITNIGMEGRLRSGVLPIHTYCLTRFGEPMQAGLDPDRVRWYSWSERFGHSVDKLMGGIADGFSSAFQIEFGEGADERPLNDAIDRIAEDEDSDG